MNITIRTEPSRLDVDAIHAFLTRSCALRRLLLKTRDAHGLYEQFGFERVEDASGFMQIKGEPG